MADAPQFDFVITVCDSAAGESCPVWLGTPITVHWGIADPADADEEHAEAAFKLAYAQLKKRIQQVNELPLEVWIFAIIKMRYSASTMRGKP